MSGKAALESKSVDKAGLAPNLDTLNRKHQKVEVLNEIISSILLLSGILIYNILKRECFCTF